MRRTISALRIGKRLLYSSKREKEKQAGTESVSVFFCCMPAGSRFSGNKGQEVSEQKASVGSIRPSVFKAHPFGMPLDAQDGESLMYNGFRHVIGSILDNKKIPAGGAYALVMGAVYGKITAVKLLEYGSGKRMAWMDLIPVRILVQGICGEILDDPSSEIDVDNLHSFADAEDRFASAYKSIEHGELLSVKCGVNAPGTMIGFSEQDRINISASG